ncbi:MAG: GNAT family N-acetyltransferase, partial [Candidatus Thermoplasmatota archaeon]|nr:GNAT family N-acetyltransferase [Candidatus Thermoplasmatota archaeon]
MAEIWGYTEEEFARLAAWTQGCGRLVEHEGEIAGMALGFPYGPVGFIGDVLVHEHHRGQGLGQAVTQAAVDALHEAGCETVKLYATPKAIPLYERMGFVGEAEFVVAAGTHKRGRDPDVVPLADHIEAALELDRTVFGGDRGKFMRDQLAAFPETSLAVIDDDGMLAGFAQARPGPEVSELGPIVVRDG